MAKLGIDNQDKDEQEDYWCKTPALSTVEDATVPQNPPCFLGLSPKMSSTKRPSKEKLAEEEKVETFSKPNNSSKSVIKVYPTHLL